VPQTRFQIEEILSQDAHGAVFLAMDARQGCEVLLQRFFPFGAGEGGLEGEERVAYDQAIQTMQQLEHPNLRRVIDGGTDPVDGMPFLVTEVRSGMSVAEYGEHAALTVAQGRVMVESALELMVWLEQRFGQTAEWLALQSEDVEVMEEGNLFRFCVDPMKWLGLRKGAGAVKDLALLVEAGMGWTGRVVTGSTAGMLSGWLRMAKTRELTVHEALVVLRTGQMPEATAAVVAAPSPIFAPVEPVVPAQNSYANPAMPAQTGGHALWYVMGAVVCVGLMGLGGFLWFRMKGASLPSAAVASVELKSESAPAAGDQTLGNDGVSPSAADEKRLRENAERLARELQANLATGEAARDSEPEEQGDPNLSNGEHEPSHVRGIRKYMGKEILMTQKVTNVRLSSSSKSLYIEFDGAGVAANRACGRYRTELAVAGLSVSELGYLIGKRVRLRGKVMEEQGTGRTIVDVTSPDQIEVLDP
jgi:hypothetical protein